MKTQEAIFIALVTAVLTIPVTSVIHTAYTTYYTEEYDMKIRVGDHLGINLDSNKLDFGIARPGDSANKKLTIENNLDRPAKIKLKAFGKISELVDCSRNNFILLPDQTETVRISLQIPKEQPPGNLTGTMRVTLKMP